MQWQSGGQIPNRFTWIMNGWLGRLGEVKPQQRKTDVLSDVWCGIFMLSQERDDDWDAESEIQPHVSESPGNTLTNHSNWKLTHFVLLSQQMVKIHLILFFLLFHKDWVTAQWRPIYTCGRCQTWLKEQQCRMTYWRGEGSFTCFDFEEQIIWIECHK